jgi:hypothetical protein
MSPQDAVVAGQEPRSGPGDLRDHGERIERLLDEVRGMAGPSTWQRVEELVRLVVELYGAGLERLIDHAAASGARGPELEARLCGDELVSSLLVLHGLHPVPTAERVRRAVGELGRRGDAPLAGLELVEVRGDGVVRVRLAGPGGCPSTRASLLRSVERAIQDAAPEVVRVEVDGVDAGAPTGRLVTIGLPHAR